MTFQVYSLFLNLLNAPQLSSLDHLLTHPHCILLDYIFFKWYVLIYSSNAEISKRWSYIFSTEILFSLCTKHIQCVWLVTNFEKYILFYFRKTNSSKIRKKMHLTMKIRKQVALSPLYPKNHHYPNFTLQPQILTHTPRYGYPWKYLDDRHQNVIGFYKISLILVRIFLEVTLR